ncbi:MAG: hypoxanthine phosphoribosyltransferase [Acidimicrobiales bacterium]|nr:MAG: hypoxanthine phosphoribosyltransferase [Acidimicrobiales bacterium]
MEKRFLSAQELVEDSFKLAVKVYESGYRPDYIVGIWRGGTPVGIVIHDFLAYVGVKVDHISVRTSYRGIDHYNQIKSSRDIQVHNTRFLVDRVNSEDSLLIVDDVFSSGRSTKAVINRLKKKLRANMPSDVKIAVPYYKPSHNRTGRKPDYVLHETDDWLVMPHELSGLSTAEIKEHRPGVHEAATKAMRAV